MIKRQNITVGNVLVSFDVVNGFGNIPTDLSMRIIERDFHFIEEHTPIPKEQFMKMLDICLNHANYFVYQGQFYKQNLGMFMGSSLAPILVERVIEDIVDKVLEKLDLTPDFWSTVDNHLTSIPRNKVEILKDTPNSFEKTVQFTVEIQKDDNTIDFLNTTVFNMGNKLKTKWYYKSIASNCILNYHSKHPTQ